MPFVEIESRRVFYAEQGQGEPVVVFVHGAGGTHQHWGFQMNALQDVARVIAPSLPGHGRSPGPACEQIGAYRDVVLELLDALGLHGVVLVGHSMGGAIVLQIALEQPERVRGLVLVSTGARLKVSPKLLDGLRDEPLEAIQSLVSSFYGSAASAETRLEGLRAYERLDPSILRGDFLACDAFDARERLGDIEQPTLIVYGEEDQMTPPKYSQFFHERIAGSQVVMITQAGHMAMLETPELVSAAIREFVQGLEN